MMTEGIKMECRYDYGGVRDRLSAVIQVSAVFAFGVSFVCFFTLYLWVPLLLLAVYFILNRNMGGAIYADEEKLTVTRSHGKREKVILTIPYSDIESVKTERSGIEGKPSGHFARLRIKRYSSEKVLSYSYELRKTKDKKSDGVRDRSSMELLNDFENGMFELWYVREYESCPMKLLGEYVSERVKQNAE